MKIHYAIFYLTFALVLYSCNEQQEQINRSGTVEISYAVEDDLLKSSLNPDRLLPGTKPDQLVTSVKDNHGKRVLNAEKIDLIQIGDTYFSKKILLPSGAYTLEEFIVIDSMDQAIYIAPKFNSKLAKYVDHPLPYSFDVKEDLETKLMIQVLPVKMGSAEDFGYVSFRIDVVIPHQHEEHLCESYAEDKQRPDACSGSRACLAGSKWQLKALIDTRHCRVRYVPDTLWSYHNKPLPDYLWIRFYENDSLSGRTVTNHFWGNYGITKSNILIISNIVSTRIAEPEWGIKFMSHLTGNENFASHRFVSFQDSLFIYNGKSKMLFVQANDRSFGAGK